MSDNKASKESRAEALKIAKRIQKPGQTKDQTKLVAQGIEKGISEYKKLQKSKARDRDRHRKKELKASRQQDTQPPKDEQRSANPLMTWLPWTLLIASWVYILLITLKQPA